MDAVRRSASQFDTPDIQLGFGIPDFQQADQILDLTTGAEDMEALHISVYPVPFQDGFTIGLPGHQQGSFLIEMFDVHGRKAWSKTTSAYADRIVVQDAVLSDLAPGAYFIRLNGRPLGTVLKVR